MRRITSLSYTVNRRLLCCTVVRICITASFKILTCGRLWYHNVFFAVHVTRVAPSVKYRGHIKFTWSKSGVATICAFVFSCAYLSDMAATQLHGKRKKLTCYWCFVCLFANFTINYWRILVVHFIFISTLPFKIHSRQIPSDACYIGRIIKGNIKKKHNWWVIKLRQ